MRVAALVAFIMTTTGSAQQVRPNGPAPAFVAFRLPATEVFLHEVFLVTIRFGIEARFREEQMIPRFSRALDLSLEVQGDPTAATLEDGDPAGLERLQGQIGEPARVAGSLSFALGGEVAYALQIADEEREGHTFHVYEHTQRCLATQSGDLVIEAPKLLLSYATRFDVDLFGERVPVDRQELQVIGSAVALAVRPLPTLGKPARFSGAVGAFEVAAAVQPTSSHMGEHAVLTLTIRGTGALDRFAPPVLVDLPGLHTQGILDEFSFDDGARTIRYDLVPTGVAVLEIPEIEFTFFDPDDGGSYRTVRTAPLPFTVEAVAGGSEPAVMNAVPDADAGFRPFEPKSWQVGESFGGSVNHEASTFAFFMVMVSPWIAFAFFFGWWRQRQRDRSDPLGARARRAPVRFREAMADGRPIDRSFIAYVAARLRSAEAAVIDPDLRTRLVHAGVADALAEWTSAHLRSLTASRYGGPPVRAERIVTEELVRELERSFRSAGRTR